MESIYNNCARTLARTLISRLRPLVGFFFFFDIRGDISTIIIIPSDFQFGLYLIKWSNFRIHSRANRLDSGLCRAKQITVGAFVIQ